MILEQIIAFKKQEVEDKKSLYPAKILEKSIHFNAPIVSLKNYLLRKDKNGIIAEFKRHSPSAGMINQYADIEKVSLGYMQAGASAISVLTDNHFFKGKNEDLTIARNFNFCPILRKDFIIDEYQIVEAKSIGADGILLIASALSINEYKKLASFARSLNLEILLEIHSENEMEYCSFYTEMVGINNRNLNNFKVDTENSVRLAHLLPSSSIKIAESGIKTPEDVIQLKNNGFTGFLIGEKFMRSASPELECKYFIKELEVLKNKNSYEPAL